ncbi:oxidoreductase [Tomitella fengzijianii]|uniref:SDR family NAD(P)-dependent oxidoreductase n=1 Tax=Tomitella fengzijianii TaxID=2597660 RepID=A0A516X1V2_9ACTN|nr:oxidoreductase [Tomitella fengzijianii]QDQ97065.1 SDR family NAD(P)-dependent oxidoreductase [Tomitella fengzijianii]
MSRSRPRPRRGAGWSACDIPRLTGRTFVVTGATSGIGLETAAALYAAGADVTLAVRNEVKGRAVADALGARPRTAPWEEAGTLAVRVLDLADLASVHRFVRDWDGPIDVLINNAGVMTPPLQRTADGFEMQMGTNHLGHFALTNLLLPHVRDRVVTVASLAERAGRIDLDDLNYQRRPYSRARAYGQAKLANLLCAAQLQCKLAGAGSTVRSVAAHPGASSTGLGNQLTIPGATELFRFGSRFVGQGAAGGALPTLFTAVEDLPGDTYVGPRGLFQLRGAPTAVGRSARARDAATAVRLWALSEELTGTAFPLR